MKNILWTLLVAAAAAGSCMAQTEAISVNMAATATGTSCTFQAQSLLTGFTREVSFAGGTAQFVKPQVSEITILKNADNCSATLLKNLFSTSAPGIPTVTITLNDSTGVAQTIQLTNAFITSLTGTSGGNVRDPLTEKVTLAYETITITDNVFKTTVSCSAITDTCR